MGRYPQAVTSTILTTTGLITPSATCSAKPLRSIFLNMGSSAHQTLTSLKKCAKLWTTSEHLLPLGTALQKESCGTSSTLKMCGDNKASPHLRAATANASTRGISVGPSRDSAPHRAKGWLAKLVALTTRHASAAYAARSSKQTNTSELKPAARLVGKKLYRAPGSRVYDLTVEDQHCFYAGGVLVGNCADAFQYFCLHYNVQINGGGYDARSKARPVIKPNQKYLYN